MPATRVKRRSRLDDFLGLDRAGPIWTGTDVSTDTLTSVEPGLNFQSRVEPGLAPIKAATASGIVDRTEAEFSMFETTFVRNSPTVTDDSPLTLLSGRHNYFGLNVGVLSIHSLLHRRAPTYR